MVVQWTDETKELDALEDEALGILRGAGWRQDEPVTAALERVAPAQRDRLIALLEELLLRSNELPRRLLRR